jgi:predicted regulator of Ras-like GTPase activity (Roadblock/LC7/MglB family)
MPSAPAAASAPVAPAVAAEPAKAEPQVESVSVPLSNLTENWPAAVKTELDQARPAGVAIAIPVSRLEGPMKTGKLNFRWNELRQWIKPSALTGTSTHGETEIQLALNVVAPLFFAHPSRNAVAKKKAEIAHDIPDVFGSTSAANAVRELASVPALAAEMPVNPSVAAQGGSATNMQVRNAQSTNANASNDRGQAQAALFAKMDWTPENTVKITCATPGVAGAMVTADDGLMISSQLPATFKSELLSAFVPQIYGRALQTAAELQLPALNCVRLTLGSQQCEIYKTGKLYYVIIGKATEELPTPFLRKIAAELTKRH